MNRIAIQENELYMVFEVAEDGCFKLLHLGKRPFDEQELACEHTNEGFRLVEVNLSGYDRPYERQGNKYIVTAPGYHLRYRAMEDTRSDLGRLLIVHLFDEITNLTVDSFVQFVDELNVVRLWNRVVNCGDKTLTLDYLSSFNYTGCDKGGKGNQHEKMTLWIPRHGWQRELDWKKYSMTDLGLELVQTERWHHSSSFVHVENTGNWSTKEFLPIGFLQNEETGDGLMWQIEHNGSWHWEVGEQNGQLYVAASGPNEVYSHWSKELKTGDSFESVPVCVSVTLDGFEDAVRSMTRYRRLIRRPNADNENLKIIFNDYMNCLWGNPTTARELPLIDAAAEAGCDYFCIDCGWYADGDWWDAVGDWQESKERFPGGMREVTDYIRSKGMIPGVWLELEVMGIHCHMAETMPDSWFFMRHGKRVYDRSRFQLDYRNHEVRAYATAVIDRLVRELGVGYIKMDYNIEPGIGTETDADSVGDGLMGHERAYLAWLDSIFAKHPELVIENCSSGGLRMDYAMLSRHSIQSTSDMEDYRTYATIAVNSPSALCPEQSAIWSYPLREGDREEVVYNMVNTMLLRIHQSGHLAELSDERRRLVAEGISVYKQIVPHIRCGLPLWPLGLSDYLDEWVCLGLEHERTILLAVWRRQGNHPTLALPLPSLKSKQVLAIRIYPSYADEPFSYDVDISALRVTLPQEYMARLFKLEILEKR